jgi:hypothetical protein
VKLGATELVEYLKAFFLPNHQFLRTQIFRLLFDILDDELLLLRYLLVSAVDHYSDKVSDLDE